MYIKKCYVSILIIDFNVLQFHEKDISIIIYVYIYVSLLHIDIFLT